MAKASGNGEVFQTSPLMVLMSFTVLCCGIIAETIMMSWELWVIPIMLVGVLVSWGLAYMDIHAADDGIIFLLWNSCNECI